MRGLIMFPVVVMLMLTFIAAPTFWEDESATIAVTRTISDAQLDAVTDTVNGLQDDFDAWFTIADFAEDWYSGEAYFEDYRDAILDELNTQWAFGLTSQIETIHELMATKLTNWIVYFHINQDGDYITAGFIHPIIKIGNYLTTSVEYEGDMTIYREVTTEQLDAVEEVVDAMQDAYGDVGELSWISKDKSKVIFAIYNILQLQFGYEVEDSIEDAYSNTQHHNMAKELASMLRDLGDPGVGGYVPDEDIYAVIVVDPEQVEFNDIFSRVGYKLNTTLLFIVIILVAAAVSIIGFRISLGVFSVALSDTTVRFITLFVTYAALWAILSLLSRPMIEDVALVGVPVYVALSAMYTFGVISSVSGGGE